MIGGRRGGLDDENILASHVFLNPHKRLPIGKRRDGDFAQLNADGFANGASQRFIGGSAENFHKDK